MNLYEDTRLCGLGRPMSPGGTYGTSRLLEMGRPYRGTRALDVGTGNGFGMAILAEWGFSPTGLEPSRKLAQMAQGSCPGGSVVIGRAESMPFPDRSFDLVLFQCVLSITDRERALAETYRVLDRGGRALIQDLSGTATGEGCLGGCSPLSDWTKRIEGSGLRVTSVEPLKGAVRNYWAWSVFSGAPTPGCESPGDVEAFLCCAVKD